MRVIFLGTPAFAVPSLRALVEAGHEVALVVTRPDKPRGRGRRLEACEVKQAAQALGLPVAQPLSVNDPEFIAQLRTLSLDLGIVVAFGRLLSAEFLAVPRHGYVNVHASLLPRWRGAAPIQRGLLNGDTEFGVTVQCVAEKMDAGDLLCAEAITATLEDTLGSLEEKLAPLGARRLLEAVAQFAAGGVTRLPQDESQATFASSIQAAEERIDWREEATSIRNRVRAFNPRPIAYTICRDERLNLFQVATVEGDRTLPPGSIERVTQEGPIIGAASGGLRLLEVQYASRRRMSGRDWANGMRLQVGERCE